MADWPGAPPPSPPGSWATSTTSSPSPGGRRSWVKSTRRKPGWSTDWRRWLDICSLIIIIITCQGVVWGKLALGGELDPVWPAGHAGLSVPRECQEVLHCPRQVSLSLYWLMSRDLCPVSSWAGPSPGAWWCWTGGPGPGTKGPSPSLRSWTPTSLGRASPGPSARSENREGDHCLSRLEFSNVERISYQTPDSLLWNDNVVMLLYKSKSYKTVMCINLLSGWKSFRA